jgi:hypothetical protein
MAKRTLALIRSLRPEQWLKNGFVLAPIVFAGRIGDPVAWQRSLLAVAAFCAASSATYLINDVLDRESDRSHPTKRLRPIAAGEVSVSTAVVSALLLAAAALAIALWLGGWFPAVLGGYLAMTLLYSAFLKEAVFVDVLVVAMGFVGRLVERGPARDGHSLGHECLEAFRHVGRGIDVADNLARVTALDDCINSPNQISIQFNLLGFNQRRGPFFHAQWLVVRVSRLLVQRAREDCTLKAPFVQELFCTRSNLPIVRTC